MNTYSPNWISANAAINGKRSHANDWIVISVPGRDESDPTLWFAAHRDRARRSSQPFATYAEALAETRKRNAQR